MAKTTIPAKRSERSPSEIIKHTVLPQVTRNGMSQFFVARPKWKPDMNLPLGMRVTRKPITGKKVAVRGQNHYGKTIGTGSIWPEDNIQSSRVPRLFYILKLPINIQVADYILHCQPGHGIFVPAGIPFTYQFKQVSRAHEMLLISLYNEGLLCWHTRRWRDADDNSQYQDQSCSVPYSRAMLYLQQLIEEATQRHQHYQVVCDSLLRIMFSLLHRELEELPVLQTGTSFPESEGASKMHQMQHAIKKTEDYIARNLRENLTIDKAARFACMSRTVFVEQFRARTGKSFNHYVQDLRFNAARELLKDGDLRVYQVAAAAGLKPDRMRVMFHEREKLSPQQYHLAQQDKKHRKR